MPAAAYKDTTPPLWSTPPDLYSSCLQQPIKTPHHIFDPLPQILTVLACSSLQRHHTTSLIHSPRSLQFSPAAANKDTTPHIWSTPPDPYSSRLQQPTKTPHHIFDPLPQILTVLACSSLQRHHTTSLIHSPRSLQFLPAAAYKDTTPPLWSTPPDYYSSCPQQPTKTPHHIFDPLPQIITVLACSSLQRHHTTSLIHSPRSLQFMPAAAYKDTTPHLWSTPPYPYSSCLQQPTKTPPLWSTPPDHYSSCPQQPTKTPHDLFDPLPQILTVLACSSLQRHHLFDPLPQILTVLACSSLQRHHTTSLIHSPRSLQFLPAAAYKDTTPHLWSTPPDPYSSCLQQPIKTPHDLFDPLPQILTVHACSSL